MQATFNSKIKELGDQLATLFLVGAQINLVMQVLVFLNQTQTEIVGLVRRVSLIAHLLLFKPSQQTVVMENKQLKAKMRKKVIQKSF